MAKATGWPSHEVPMYVTIPMKLASCCLSMGSVSVIPWIFLGQLCMSSARDSWPLQFQFLTVQDKAFQLGHIQQVYEVGIMVFAGAIDHNVIMDDYHS